MTFKDILAPILSVKEDEAALAAAAAIASASDAHVTALLFEVEPDPVYTVEGAVVSVVWTQMLDQARKQFAAEKQALDRRAMEGVRPITTRELEVAAAFLGRDAGLNARYADLTVMVRPGDGRLGDLRRDMFEGILFGAGRPVLLAPPAWREGSIGRNVVVAWNGKREAARALADAGPFLERADKITILSIGAGKGKRDFGPGAADDAVAHLTRKGIRAERRNVDNPGVGEGEILLAEASALKADLVVMGGYGRSRLGEFIFGGVTQYVIDAARVPLFMSH